MIEYELTPEEFTELMEASRRARSTPVILVGGVDMSAEAHRAVERIWDRVADRVGCRVTSITSSARGERFFLGLPK